MELCPRIFLRCPAMFVLASLLCRLGFKFYRSLLKCKAHCEDSCRNHHRKALSSPFEDPLQSDFLSRRWHLYCYWQCRPPSLTTPKPFSQNARLPLRTEPRQGDGVGRVPRPQVRAHCRVVAFLTCNVFLVQNYFCATAAESVLFFFADYELPGGRLTHSPRATRGPGRLCVRPNTKPHLYWRHDETFLCVITCGSVSDAWPKTSHLLPVWPGGARKLGHPC